VRERKDPKAGKKKKTHFFHPDRYKKKRMGTFYDPYQKGPEAMPKPE